MGLKLADVSTVKRFLRGDDEDWIKGNEKLAIAPHPQDKGDDAWVEVRTVLSKAEDASINDATASERIFDKDERIHLKPARQAAADPLVFDMLVTAWSLGEPSRETYEKLEAKDAEWIDSCIRRAIDIARGNVEGNSGSLGKADQPSNSPDSSQAEDAPN